MTKNKTDGRRPFKRLAGSSGFRTGEGHRTPASRARSLFGDNLADGPGEPFETVPGPSRSGAPADESDRKSEHARAPEAPPISRAPLNAASQGLTGAKPLSPNIPRHLTVAPTQASGTPGQAGQSAESPAQSSAQGDKGAPPISHQSAPTKDEAPASGTVHTEEATGHINPFPTTVLGTARVREDRETTKLEEATVLPPGLTKARDEDSVRGRRWQRARGLAARLPIVGHLTGFTSRRGAKRPQAPASADYGLPSEEAPLSPRRSDIDSAPRYRAFANMSAQLKGLGSDLSAPIAGVRDKSGRDLLVPPLFSYPWWQLETGAYRIFGAIVLVLLVSMIDPFLTAALSGTGGRSVILIPLAGALIFALWSGVSEWCRRSEMRLQGAVERRMKIALAQQVLQAPFSRFRAQGREGYRLQDLNAARGLVKTGFELRERLFTDLPVIVGLGALLFTYSPLLAGLAGLILLLVRVHARNKALRSQADLSTLRSSVARSTAEFWDTVRVVRMNGKGEQELTGLADDLEEAVRRLPNPEQTANDLGLGKRAAGLPISEVLAGVGVAVIVAFAGAQASSFGLGPAALLTFAAAMLLVYRPLDRLLDTQALARLYTKESRRLAAHETDQAAGSNRPRPVPSTATATSSATPAAARDTAQETGSSSPSARASEADLGSNTTPKTQPAGRSLPPLLLPRDKAKPIVRPRASGNSLRIRDVTLRYAPSRIALEQVSIDVADGQTVALVGPERVPAQELFDILLGFIEPDAGEVTLGGLGIRQFNSQDLYDRVGLITATPVVFADTVAANIAYRSPDQDRSLVKKAAEAMNVHDRIMALPHGYETVLRGRRDHTKESLDHLIALSRIALTPPPLLLVDEPPQAFVQQEEAQLSRALQKLYRGRTVLVHARRGKTLLGAHKIYVFAGGEVVQTGTHQELLARGGLYAALHQRYFLTDQEGARLGA